MKLSVAIAALLSSSFAKAATTNLRSATKSVDDTDGQETFGARLAIGGLTTLPSKDDLVVLDQAVVEAYNAAYMDADAELESATSHTSVALDDGVTTMVMAEIVGWSGGGYCDLCWDDHDDFHCYITPGCSRMVSEVDFKTTKAAMVHGKFQNLLCKKLRTSGFSLFANAKDCSFEIVENPGSVSTRLSESVVYEAQNTHPTRVEIAMDGLNKEPSAADMEALGRAILGAHNKAFKSLGYGITKLDVDSFVTVGESTLFAGAAVPVFHKGEHNPEPVVAVSIHQAFETAFCGEIENLAAFAGVRDCKFHFVYNPVEEFETKKGAKSTATV